MDVILREPEVKKITQLSKPTRWRMERAGTFPKRVKLSPNCVGWYASEIAAWLESRKGGSDAA